jgi:predicted component of type VI protein secretion system
MAPGRHMFVWVWTYAGSSAPQWSTCFDVTIEGSASDSGASGGSSYSAPAASPVANANVNAAAAAPSPVAPAADTPAPQPPATTPAPEPPVTAWDQVVETVFTTVDVWTTVWDYQKRNHIRQFKP